ncbi:DNRLRE domain-containing protein [Fulvivirgaceae bacterium BMA10]|uniref:DNRLRE domain-containing protein n=1 Tax=Splendidivirga corallicola TaxID=3051826 RepID=A0ABT8KTT5_9BACT|nr:DNRLRE domain-containing protein [Fulvivirgaceae bacterium BMA10]
MKTLNKSLAWYFLFPTKNQMLYQGRKAISLSAFVLLLGAFFNIVSAQNEAPFQMPANGNEDQIYDDLDYYHFSAAAWDSQNRPYGFNINKEFGYIRTLRNGIWKEINYLDDLQSAHPGETIATANGPLDHGASRISITSDNHLYMTLQYKVGSANQWAILYLDDLEAHNFQVIKLTGSIQVANVEEFTGHNLKNGDTPAILITENGETFAQLGWDPWKSYPWTISSVNILKLAIPYRDTNGTITLNYTTITTRGGATTIHSGGNSTLVTRGSKTYVTYTKFDETKINTLYQGKNDTRSVNQGYIAEITRPATASGTATITERYMGLQFPYDAIDSHSQGAIVLDSNDKLHYIPGDHVHADKYYRTTHAITDAQFNISNNSEWTQYGTIMSTANQDFSYETLVIDDNDQIHVAYRQRSASAGIQRGLFYKNASISTTNWGTGYGTQLIAPPSPYHTNGTYIILYHRLWMDRDNHVYFSSTFYDGDSGPNGRYPRINGYRDGGSGNGTWKELNRYRHLENIKNGKTVQHISFSMGDQSLANSPVTLNATTDAAGLTISYEVVSGPATVSGNTLTLTGTGEVTIKAKNSGNTTYYGDEVLQTFQVTSGSIQSLSPEADAYVQDGGAANTNFGTGTALTVKKDGTGYNRQTYLRFDLSSVSGTITSAKLKLVPSANGSTISATTIQAKFVSNDSWIESGTNSINWNNKPAAGSVLDSQTGSPSETEWDVTSQAEAERNGDGKLSLVLESTVTGSNNWIVYNSKETSNATLRPVLIVSTSSSQSLSTEPEADAFVRDGGSSNANFGTGTVLTVKRDGTGYNRHAYLRFDLSSVSGTITSAKLKMTPNSSGPTIGATTIEAKFVSNDSWIESGVNSITWNNKPAAGSVLDSQTGSASETEWDVTTQAETERSGDGKLSIVLQSTVIGSGSFVGYHSRESSNTTARPTLIISTSGSTARNANTIVSTPVKEALETQEESIAVIALYPSPVKDHLTLRGNLKIGTKGKILSSLGQIISEFEITSSTNANIDVTLIPKGIYILSFLDNQLRKINLRFMKE